MITINLRKRSQRMSLLVLGLGLWFSRPAQAAAFTAFGVMPALQNGESIVVHVINGQTSQDVTVTLFDPAGTILTSQSATLGAGGTASGALTLSWVNSGVIVPHITIKIDAGNYFYNAGDGAVFLFITGFSADNLLLFQADRESFLTPISHDLMPSDPNQNAGSASNNSFTVTTLQNYPNPFQSHQGTHFIYALGGSPDSVQKIDIRIWSPSGHLVKSLGVRTNALRGVIAWDGKDDGGKPVATGVYIAEIIVNSSLSFPTRLKLAAIGGN
jgi:hypothetical protein